jgi:hypothetical protein
MAKKTPPRRRRPPVPDIIIELAARLAAAESLLVALAAIVFVRAAKEISDDTLKEITPDDALMTVIRREAGILVDRTSLTEGLLPAEQSDHLAQCAREALESLALRALGRIDPEVLPEDER